MRAERDAAIASAVRGWPVFPLHPIEDGRCERMSQLWAIELPASPQRQIEQLLDRVARLERGRIGEADVVAVD